MRHVQPGGQGASAGAMKPSNVLVATFAFGLLAAALSACGDASRTGGLDGFGGTTGGGSGGSSSAGAAGSGADAGSSGEAGAAGAGGDAGSAGAAGSAGNAGASGSGNDPSTDCIQSGGVVTTALCCASASDFPNTCAIGACSCAPSSSIDVLFCQCAQGSCFDGTSCVSE